MVEELRDLFPIALLVVVLAYLWWLNKDRVRANTYQGEAEEAKAYRAKSYEHITRSEEHMDRVESALERIATALEDRSRDGS